MGQTNDIEKAFEEEYAKRITKSRINGVYIPKDLEDAVIEVKRLSDPGDLKKFAAQPEEEVSRKLHFGLGRWMIVNWGFYEGSRFSHYMKENGVSFPDDMAQVVMRALHRDINGLNLNQNELMQIYIDRRAEEHQKILDEAETIGKRKRERNE